MFAEDITLFCAVEVWRELTLELDIILHKSVFRFGFVWFQHILYMQFSHLGLPCARCGQNSAAPFPEPTVPFGFLEERVHLVTRTPGAPRSREGPYPVWINLQGCHAGRILTAMGTTCYFGRVEKSPVDDLLQYFFGSFINAILDRVFFLRSMISAFFKAFSIVSIHRGFM